MHISIICGKSTLRLTRQKSNKMLQKTKNEKKNMLKCLFVSQQFLCVCNSIRCTVCSFIIYVAFYWCDVVFYFFKHSFRFFTGFLFCQMQDKLFISKYARTYDRHRCSRTSRWRFFWFGFPKYCATSPLSACLVIVKNTITISKRYHF